MGQIKACPYPCVFKLKQGIGKLGVRANIFENSGSTSASSMHPSSGCTAAGMIMEEVCCLFQSVWFFVLCRKETAPEQNLHAEHLEQ